MRWRSLLLMVLTAAGGLAGCLDEADVHGTGALLWETEPSMAPDFTGDGPAYPILLVHTHETESRRERREREEGPIVVCTPSGVPVPLEPAAVLGKSSKPSADAAMAPCMGPPVDEATGRLYANRSAFERDAPDGILAFPRGCDGGLLRFGGARADAQDSYLVRLPGHDFNVTLHANGTFAVDDRWLAPGTALKVSYRVAPGDREDEKQVRAVFDAPGRWLVARVGERVEGDLPIVRPERGTGLEARVPIDAADAGSVLGPLLAATPGADPALLALRVVHQDGRLTEVRADVATDAGVVSWFGAGRVQGQVRVLGAVGAVAPDGNGTGVPVAEFVAAFPEPFARYAAGAGTVDLRLARDRALASPTGTWQETIPAELGAAAALPCDGTCLHAWVDAAVAGGWRDAPLARQAPAVDARTLEVRVLDDVGGEALHLWHVP